MYYGDLATRLADVSGKSLYHVFSNWDSCIKNKKIQSKVLKRTRASIITIKDARIAFQRLTIQEIWARLRAVSHQEHMHGCLVSNGKKIIFDKLLDPDLYQIELQGELMEKKAASAKHGAV